MMGFAMYRLAERPDLQERLGREPEIIGKAVDECVRRHGLSNITRIAARDMEFAGAPLREGDAIVTPSGLIGLDPDRFPDPTALDFDRPSGVATAASATGRTVARAPISAGWRCGSCCRSGCRAFRGGASTPTVRR
jgi:cytochrome P450